MYNSVEKILYRKAALIFEELAFLLPRSENYEVSSIDGTSAMVTFKGAFSGCLLVSLSSKILPRLSSNMLGEEGRPDPSLEQDSLCEIANVICGNSLPAIYGFESVFHLDAPTLLDAADSLLHGNEFRKEAQVTIPFDSGYAVVMLLVDSNTPTSAPS